MIDISINSGKKFDIVLMNPPYAGTTHLKFLNKVLQITNNTVTIQPIIWLFGQNSSSSASDAINNIKTYINKYKTNIEKIDATKFNSAAIPQEVGIIYISNNESDEINVKYNDSEYTLKDIEDNKKYGNDKLLSKLDNILKPIYKEDNFWNHITFSPRAKGHLGKRKNEEKIDFNPNIENIIINIPQIRGHVNQTDFYTTTEAALKPVKYKNYRNAGKTTPWSYIVCKNEQYGENIARYLKTDFVRSCLYFNKFSTTLPIDCIPWFDFSDEHFSKTPHEIDNWLFDKYNISDEIRKHIEEILPDYYNIRPKTND